MSESLRIVTVLGHSGCGAVTAAVDAFLDSSRYPTGTCGFPLRAVIDRVLLSVVDADAALGRVSGESVRERTGYRVSVHHYQSNGFRTNPYLGREDTNGRDETSFRARLVWEPGDNWDVRVTGMFSDIDDGYDAFAIDNSLTVLSNRPGRDEQNSAGVSVNLDWSGSRYVRITSVTSVAESDIVFSFDADWGNDDAWSPVLYDYISFSDRRRTTINREVRFLSTENSRLFNDTTDWLVGFYFNQLDEDLTTINQGDYFDPGFNFADALDDRLDSEFEAMSLALFGRLALDVSEQGSLTLGVRVERRDVDYFDSSGLDLEPDETMVGGEISYIHRFDDDTNGFVTLARGYKGGGFNLGFVPQGRREFDSESMWNLEVGLKTSSPDDRWFYSSSIFYNVRDDQQVETSFQIDPNDPASFVFFTDNAAEGETFGLEADVRYTATDRLELFANLGLLVAEFDEFVTPQVDASGRDQAHAPRYTFMAGGIYRHESGWFGRIDISGKDEFYFDVSHDQVSDAYNVTNARVGFEADRWTAQLWLRNAFDERYAVRGFFFGNEPPLFPPTLYIRQGDPRHIGITVDMRF